MDARRFRCFRALVPVLLVALLSSGCTHFGLGITIDDLIDQGIELYQAGRYDDSMAKFEEAIRRDPKRWIAYLYLARSFAVKNDWPSAILNGRKALEIRPGDPEIVGVLAGALHEAGLASLRNGQWKAAAAHLLDYVELRPSDARGYLGLARAQVGSGDFEGAARALIEGVTKAGTEGGRADLVAELRHTAGQALAGGDPGAAARLLSSYVQHDPRDAAAWVDLGKAFWASGQSTQALDAFRRALSLSPGNPEAQRFLTR